jgi:hypothetical protein
VYSSHKKDHTVFGDSSESLGLRVKDVLDERNVLGFFDGRFTEFSYTKDCPHSLSFVVDDLKQIDQAHINEGILASCW